jgi:hypothetical protein
LRAFKAKLQLEFQYVFSVYKDLFSLFETTRDQISFFCPMLWQHLKTQHTVCYAKSVNQSLLTFCSSIDSLRNTNRISGKISFQAVAKNPFE